MSKDTLVDVIGLVWVVLLLVAMAMFAPLSPDDAQIPTNHMPGPEENDSL